MTEVRQQPLRLLVELSDGRHIQRDIAPAMPLTVGGRRGAAVEAALHDAAATWGLRDFVFPPVLADKGTASREVGDGILLVGRRGVIIQSKARDQPGRSVQREQAWVGKQVTRAYRQARGSLRTLQAGPLAMTNLRGRTIEIDGSQVQWAMAVIIDHPDPPAVIPASEETIEVPAVVLTRRDWEFLFHQLKSGWAVADYIRRAGQQEPCELGQEPVRYFQLAQADEASAPEHIDPKLLGRSGLALSTPLLPLRAAGSEADPAAYSLVRMIIEDAAIGRWSGEADERHRLLVLGELDRLPVARRAQFGKFFIEALEQVTAAPAGQSLFRVKRIQGGAGQPHILLAAISEFSAEHQKAFAQLLQLRHYERLQLIGGDDGGLTVGVFLTLRVDGPVGFDTSVNAVSGSWEYDPEDLAALQDHWGRGSDF